MAVGKNAPPVHPSCHCCTAPALDEEKWQSWLDGPAQAGVPWVEFESDHTQNIDKSYKEIRFPRRNDTDGEDDGIINITDETPLSPLIEQLTNSNIKNNPVSSLESELSSEEIIKKIHGKDKDGSCTSLALAYIGNRNGLDVTDLRGGESADFFADVEVIKKIVEMANGYTIQKENDFDAVKLLLKNVKDNNEYFLSTGRHTAIIRKAKRGCEYLRLQDGRGIGFARLDNKALKDVFKCTKTHSHYGSRYEASSMLFDIGNLKNNAGFAELLGYLNTKEQ